ncbi:hypothetical protein CC117_20400 [Parafrankia colletiae]|uniref:PepSY domain-containing protein n=1 Tax=Parafrankia colletiae TaxID=573497 RepID=A0A1S1QJQ0_9ACTN|nr:hypothetical protein [Parafrankia colletiae]MCK9904480.1 hypothetical protein [Frankia sp. Cpl3]OHV34998.1 hypothetical protein CC117_20400 [Parafrankia colletiae]
MTRRKKTVIGVASGALVMAMVGGGVGIATASGGGDSSAPITGTALEKASAAALAYTAGGRVTDTETGDEDGYYEVEVTTTDRGVMDVHLDRDFAVISGVTDSDSGPDDQADSDTDADDVETADDGATAGG